jgi:hypothetical protein
MENAWQFSKVYPEHVGADGNPTPEYFEWAKRGWSSWRSRRDPMGEERRGRESFHWWDGERLSKVVARKLIYAPLYAEQVVKTEAFKVLKDIWQKNRQFEEFTLYLMDFDAYEYNRMSFSEVLNNPRESMGHGFVLAMLLTENPALQECELRLA